MPILVSLLIIFLAILLLYHNWNMQPGTIWFSFSMILIGLLQLTHYFAFSGVSVSWLAIFFIHPTPTFYLIGPFLLFYVRNILSDQNRLSWKDFWHFIPSIALFISNIPYVIKPWSYKIWAAERMIEDIHFMVQTSDLMLYPAWVNVILRPISWVGYTCYSLYLVIRFQQHYPVRHRIPHQDARRVLRFVIAFLLVCLATQISYTALSIEYYLKFDTPTKELVATPWTLLTSIGIAFIPFILLLYPDILYGIPRWNEIKSSDQIGLPEKGDSPIAIVTDSTDDISAVQGQEDSLENLDYFKLLADRIYEMMETQKPYLDPEFSPDDMARILNVPKHHLYYCLNKIMNIRFTRLRAEYRVRHARLLIDQGETRQKTLEAIGMESGFANRISFHKVFREVSGMSPSDYLRTHNQLG